MSSKCPICDGLGHLFAITTKEILELCPGCWGKGYITLKPESKAQ